MSPLRRVIMFHKEKADAFSFLFASAKADTEVNMLKVGICDDELLIRENLHRKIVEIANKYELHICVSCYESGSALLEEIDTLEAVFLDIDMPELDGIETGKRIGKKNQNCKIIMATGRMDKFKEAFRIQAFRFVTKPFDDGEIEEALQAIMSTRIGMERIELYENRNSFQVPQRDILYIAAYNGYSEFMVVGTDKTLRKECSLSELEQELSRELFFRINRQCMVNLRWITEYENGYILLQDKRLLISRRRKKEFEQAYLAYDLRYRG